ncbi:hypothetical protein BpHYR1_042405 [Brachionus plicatilis]|uniref:Uncharacterized protein n=1 Tax=Brachionus plicatilis TaxID=10195 RepID=A0A3M7RI99_BRAPC|nr:hypothetical protein BpHYR1_042405 [Brachionus plicatilis]
MILKPFHLTIFLIGLAKLFSSKSIIIANYHNVLLYFPREYGGNDDIRVVFDVRNVTFGTFKYIPVVVDVAYDSFLNHAYCYLESAVTSYILLLKWAGGAWCYQILFEFPASQFSKYMYHSIVLMDDFLYWTTDRYIMTGRTAGYEKRLLLQPGWNRLYSMSQDYQNQLIYVSAFDYTENAIFKCSLRLFSCQKLLTSSFPINYVLFNQFSGKLYATSMQGSNGRFLFRYEDDFKALVPVQTVDEDLSSILFLSQDFAVYSNQQTITVSNNINKFNSSRKTSPKMVDPYALQYIFSFNQQINFETYPYPYFFTDYQNLLYKNSLYLFYYYICGMDVVESDQAFVPQMDLNNNFLYIGDCQTRFMDERNAILVPSVIGGCVGLVLIIVVVMVCLWRSAMCRPRVDRLRSRMGLVAETNRSMASDDSMDEKKESNLVYSLQSELYDKEPINLGMIDCSRYRFQPSLSIDSSSSDELKFKTVSPMSSVSANSANRVKFSDRKIEHFYDKEEVPKHSKMYHLEKDQSGFGSKDGFCGSPSYSDYRDELERNDKKLSKYFTNCDISLYGSNSNNYIDMVKSIGDDVTSLESKIMI